MRRLLSLLLLWAIALTGVAGGFPWHEDILGSGFQMRYVTQPDDALGAARSAEVRHLVPVDSLHRGVLYIHGFNDYFFQREMAEEFVNHGYNFFAVDLRRYGRALMDGQRTFDIRSLKDYFPDIDSAIVDMQRIGITSITLMGHSTGGLIAAYYMSVVRPEAVKDVILNSPFLDWNLGRREWLIPLVTAWGKWFPGTTIPQGSSGVYGESLLRRFGGEWDYNENWKKVHSPDVTAGWVRAITLAQRSLRDGRADIDVPVLVMRSSVTVTDASTPEQAREGDVVLDVDDIARYGGELGDDVTLLVVPGGVHDLFLSRPAVRAGLYDYVFAWLARVAST